MTNQAAMGYAIMAAKVVGLNEKQIRLLLAAMNVDMDIYTEEDAEEVYRNT